MDMVAQLAALDAAIASGALRVSYDGKSVEYRSLDEMLRVRADLASAIVGRPRRRRLLVTTAGDKGL